ncbi:hypothetical protein MAR_010546 [Mya arenaria]|uniref:Transmembrane protein n=1 Tax=Mya arenaria TaxID=6604 RepID=A0ABY7E1T9_MYAAR|nr:hypothetical protein MAR_010546 [Mya arenaria]
MFKNCFGCLRLLFAVFGVICSLAKVFVASHPNISGAEYISACAARDIIPVYLVVSGCLPVLLVTLKEPYDATGNIHRHEAQLKVGVAVVAVAANLAWLIAGTVWTSLLLADSGYGGNLCTQETLCATPPPGEPDLSLDDLTKTTTGDGIFENKDKSITLSSSLTMSRAGSQRNAMCGMAGNEPPWFRQAGNYAPLVWTGLVHNSDGNGEGRPDLLQPPLVAAIVQKRHPKHGL